MSGALINTKDYPELDLICWNSSEPQLLTRALAFAMYEGGWEYLDYNALTDREKSLIADLTKNEGGGVFHGGF